MIQHQFCVAKLRQILFAVTACSDSVLETVGQGECRSKHFEGEADYPDLMRTNLCSLNFCAYRPALIEESSCQRVYEE